MTLLVLLACATASLDAATAPPAEELVSPDRHGSLVETSDTLLRVHAELQGLSPQRLAEVQQAPG